MKNFSPLCCFKKLKKRHLIALSLPLLSYANGFKIQEQSLNGTALGSAYVA
ncbi:outer membrane transport family protein, partial [Helicobacter pylori]|nr:outer membrane transport family protein [Helicobacter pylori]